MNENDVLNTVETYVNQHQPAAYRLNVLRQGVKHEGNWWYVVVQSTPPDIRARDYANIMEQVEEQIKAQHNVNVLLVPVLPGD